MTLPSISILGCGWLGLPLAQHLVSLGYPVKGSSTSAQKLELLQGAGIMPFQIRSEPELIGDIDPFFDAKVLFLNIPFRRNLPDPHYYKQQIDAVISHAASSPIEFIIFAGTTSIYPDTVREAVEDAALVPQNKRSETLLQIEHALMDHPGFQATVLRFAGLYGGERKIGRMLAGKEGLGDGDSPVNLIHLEDCIGIVTAIIQKDIRGEVFNACSDGHPTRKQLYTCAARHNRFEAPQFNDQPPQRIKVVRNAKLKEKLNYTFKYPDPMIF